jgi:hypothetical protein
MKQKLALCEDLDPVHASELPWNELICAPKTICTLQFIASKLVASMVVTKGRVQFLPIPRVLKLIVCDHIWPITHEENDFSII